MKEKILRSLLFIAMMSLSMLSNNSSSYAMSPHFSYPVDAVLPPLKDLYDVKTQYRIKSQSVRGMFTVRDTKRPGFTLNLIKAIEKELIAAAEKEYSKLQESEIKRSQKNEDNFLPPVESRLSLEYVYANTLANYGVACGIAIIRRLGYVTSVVIVSTADNGMSQPSLLSDAYLNSPDGFIIRTIFNVFAVD